MIQQQVTILENQPAPPAHASAKQAVYYQMVLDCPEMCAKAEPGQFVMLRLTDTPSLLLPRPFSICGLSGGTPGGTTGVTLLYKVVGAGTKKMAALSPGDTVSLVGPLGQGFSADLASGRIFLVAGGIGVAPMVFLAQKIAGQKCDCTVFLGGAGSADLLCRDFFAELDIPVQVATEDGSAGTKGLVTDILAAAIATKKPDAIFTCGPNGMTKAVMALAEKYQIPCQVSIETMMSCGIGACLGCAVPSNEAAGTYLHACKDGPVFDAKKIRLP